MIAKPKNAKKKKKYMPWIKCRTKVKSVPSQKNEDEVT